MKPLITFNNLPEEVMIDGILYPINYGYRTMMAIEMEMFGGNNDEQKILTSLNLFYGKNIPENTKEAIKYMLWFHGCGEEKKKGIAKGASKGKRAYCFSQDAPLIYAAFMQQYRINLKNTKSKELHWWEFQALFSALSEEVKISKVMYWRTCNLNDIPKSKKAFIKRMKQLYEIKENGSVEERMKLSERNARMKEYVRARREECRK